MAKEKEITTFNVQIAEFIRHHKKEGTATDDEVTEKLVIPFTLMLTKLMICLSV